MSWPSVNNPSAKWARTGMALCDTQESRADRVRILVAAAVATSTSRPSSHLRRAASGNHRQLSPRLNPVTKAICIGPSEPDRACSTTALHLPRRCDPVTRVRLLVFAMKCSELGGSVSFASTLISRVGYPRANCFDRVVQSATRDWFLSGRIGLPKCPRWHLVVDASSARMGSRSGIVQDLNH
jgi:hypothetical protein